MTLVVRFLSSTMRRLTGQRRQLQRNSLGSAFLLIQKILALVLPTIWRLNPQRANIFCYSIPTPSFSITQSIDWLRLRAAGRKQVFGAAGLFR